MSFLVVLSVSNTCWSNSAELSRFDMFCPFVSGGKAGGLAGGRPEECPPDEEVQALSRDAGRFGR